MKKKTIIAAALSCLIASSQVMATGQKVCLQRNRLQSWRAIDQNTLVMTDRSRKDYRVKFRNACPNVTEPTATIVFGHSWRNLQCLDPGQAFNVTAPGRGLRTCRVATVTAA